MSVKTVFAGSPPGRRSLVALSMLLALLALAAPPASAEPTASLAELEAALFSAPAPAADEDADSETDARQGMVEVGGEARVSFTSPAIDRPAGALTKRTLLGADAEPVWTEIIHYPGASYIAPHFERLVLPEGARLEVRAANGTRSWTYTGTGKAGLGATEGFWGVHMPGDRAILELYAPGAVAPGAVRIDSFAHGYDSFHEVGRPDGLESLTAQLTFDDEAICGADDSDWAQCYQVSEPTIYDKSRAVIRLLINGTSACTGWFVGSAGHVLTNEHCIGSSSAALNTDYEAMAEAACGVNCGSFGACPGTVVAASGTLIRSNAALDYTLVELPVNPTATYGYLQMRGSGAQVGERIYIPGHPAAWGKRISVTSSDSRDSSGFCEVQSTNATPCSGGPGDTGYYCDTRGGSSGSPVLGYGDHLVVSLHHCANCPNRGVPIEAVIADLGSDVPPDGVVGNPPPPPSCFAKGDSCSVDGDCCSNKCKGPSGAKTCK